MGDGAGVTLVSLHTLWGGLVAAGRADTGARLRSVLPNTPHQQSSVMMSVNRHGGPQLTGVCWPKGSSEKGRHLEPKAPSFHFLEVSAGMKSHGSGWWGARDSRQAQARGGVPGQAQPRAPSCLLSVPACPAHSMLLGARAWRGLSPTFSAVSAPWSPCARGPGPGTLSLLTWLTVGPR